MRVVRGISLSLCIVLLLLTCRALSAQNQEHRVRILFWFTVAWADGSGWKGFTTSSSKTAITSVSSRNRKLRLKTMWLQQSALSLFKTDRAFLSRTLWGAVITEAGQIRRSPVLVYIAATCPMLERTRRMMESAFPSDLSKSGAIKKTADGFHVPRLRAVS